MTKSTDSSKVRVLEILRTGKKLSAVDIAAEYYRIYCRKIQDNTVNKNICLLRQEGHKIEQENIRIPNSDSGYFTRHWINNDKPTTKPSVYDLSCPRQLCRRSGFFWKSTGVSGRYECECGQRIELSREQMKKYLKGAS